MTIALLQKDDRLKFREVPPNFGSIYLEPVIEPISITMLDRDLDQMPPIPKTRRYDYCKALPLHKGCMMYVERDT